MGVFKAYDIRGIYNSDFDKDDVYKIGYFLPKLLNTKEVLIGYDGRCSSPEIFEYLCMGITDRGADVYTIGLSTTPMVYFTTASHKFHASVQITASHNSKEYNGLKISKTDAIPVGYESGLDELEEMVKTGEVIEVKEKGKIHSHDVRKEYIEFLKRYVPDICELKVGIDCSNGMASILIKDILGNSPVYIYDTIDGSFPNHEPNPLLEENVEDLKKLVLQNKCDIGVIYDGDADRVVFVDENARFIPPDLIIGVLGMYYLEKEKGNVLHDIRTSKAVSEYITGLGGTPFMWKVGHAYAKVKLREISGIFGGELAGHYYFRDFFNCDSGILASLIVLSVACKMKKEGKSFSSIIDSIKKYSNSGEINFRIRQKSEAMEKLKKDFIAKESPTAFFDFDGYRIEFKDWWFNVRSSNTEPYLRLIVEAQNDVLLQKKLSELTSVINSFE